MNPDANQFRPSANGARWATADAVLWILAGLSVALLIYEWWTLATAVVLPLVANPNAIQTDFHYYYDAALRFRADPAQLYRLSDDVIQGFAYPPPAILPFVALSHLPLGTALLVFSIVSYAAVVVSIVLWLRYLHARGIAVNRGMVAIALIALALGPTYSNAIFGQVNTLVLLCGVMFVTLGPRWPALGGASLAMGVWLKIYPVVIVAIGLWNRSAWRRIVYAALFGAAAIIVALPLIPMQAYLAYVNDVLPLRFDKTAIHILNQSLVAFIERFAMPPERYVRWTGEQAIVVGAAVRAFNWAFGVAVIALLWRRAGRGARVEAVDGAAGVMALAAVIAPLGWGHTFVLVLPLLMLHLASLRDARAWEAAIVAGCVVALMVPAGRRFGVIEPLSPWIQNLVYSRYLLAALVLIALPPASASSTDTRR